MLIFFNVVLQYWPDLCRIFWKLPSNLWCPHQSTSILGQSADSNWKTVKQNTIPLRKVRQDQVWSHRSCRVSSWGTGQWPGLWVACTAWPTVRWGMVGRQDVFALCFSNFYHYPIINISLLSCLYSEVLGIEMESPLSSHLLHSKLSWRQTKSRYWDRHERRYKDWGLEPAWPGRPALRSAELADEDRSFHPRLAVAPPGGRRSPRDDI